MKLTARLISFFALAWCSIALAGQTTAAQASADPSAPTHGPVLGVFDPVDPSPASASPASPSLEQKVIGMADQAEMSRESNLLGYSDIEHYVITNNRIGTPEIALVNVVYTAGKGKAYSVVSQSGPFLLHKVLDSVLASETELSGGPTRKAALITSSNYAMKLLGRQSVAERPCYLLSITPLKVNEYTLKGRIWVDAATGLLVRLEGVPGASPSFLAGKPNLSRDYGAEGGFALATHSTATSSGILTGRTTIYIDYTDYKLPPRQP